MAKAKKTTKKKRAKKKTKRPLNRKKYPVVTASELLPLDELEWQRFETFCEAFIKTRQKYTSVQRYGKRGQDQRGIDFIASVKKDRKDAFQCKHYESFDVGDAKAAVNATTYQADSYTLLVACEVDREVRDFFGNRKNWHVLDIRDISREVLALPFETARNLIHHHFGPHWASALLGTGGFGPFLPPLLYFQRWLRPGRLFHHAAHLVGREKHLKQLHAFVDSQKPKVALISGRGGIGKTKILFEFCKRLAPKSKNLNTYILAEGVSITNESLNQLNPDASLIIADDAHRREDLGALLEYAHRSNYCKLILSARPQGLASLRSQLTQAGFDTRDIASLDDVNELDSKDVERLASIILGPKFKGFSKQLVAVSKDCPLVTVIGGTLLAEESIDPSLLVNSEAFRNEALNRFQDISIGRISDQVNPDVCRAILRLVSAIGPFRLYNRAIVEEAAKFVGVQEPELLRICGILEELGVLSRIGSLLRITPDVLSDHILDSACVSTAGVTGYADQVFEAFVGLCPESVLRNLGELDWRISHRQSPAPDLLREIWRKIREDFRACGYQERAEILKILTSVAFYQPDQVLNLVEDAFRLPVGKEQNEASATIYRYSQKNVLKPIPQILGRISYNINYLERSVSLLWELGKDDERELNPNPDHAVRVISDLCSYQLSKPVSFNLQMVRIVASWIDEYERKPSFHSPIQLLASFLQKTAHETAMQGHNFVTHAFVINRKNTIEVRKEALNALKRSATSHNALLQLEALDVIEAALQAPVPYMNLKLSRNDLSQWKAEREEVLDIAAVISKKPGHPIVRVRLADVLDRQTEFSRNKDLSSRVKSLRKSIKHGFFENLARLLSSRLYRDRTPSRNESWEEMMKRRDEIHAALAKEFIKRFPKIEGGLQIVEEYINLLDQYEASVDVSSLAYALVKTDSEIGSSFATAIIREKRVRLAAAAEAAMAQLHHLGDSRLTAIIDLALSSDSTVMLVSLARALGNFNWAKGFTEDDLKVFDKLLANNDDDVKVSTVYSATSIARSNREQGLALLKKVEVGQSVKLAAALCNSLDEHHSIPVGTLSPNDMEELLFKLKDVPDLHNQDISDFINTLSVIDPELICKFIDARISIQLGPAGNKGYRAVSYHDMRTAISPARNSEAYKKLVSHLKDAYFSSSPEQQYWVGQIFKELCPIVDGDVKQMLTPQLFNGTEDEFALAVDLLSESDHSVVFRDVPFTASLLDRAESFSSDRLERMIGTLLCIATGGMRSGVPGVPRPLDVQIRDYAMAEAAKVTATKATKTFFEELADFQEKRIKGDLDRDAEMAGLQ